MTTIRPSRRPVPVVLARARARAARPFHRRATLVPAHLHRTRRVAEGDPEIDGAAEDAVGHRAHHPIRLAGDPDLVVVLVLEVRRRTAVENQLARKGGEVAVLVLRCPTDQWIEWKTQFQQERIQEMVAASKVEVIMGENEVAASLRSRRHRLPVEEIGESVPEDSAPTRRRGQGNVDV